MSKSLRTKVNYFRFCLYSNFFDRVKLNEANETIKKLKEKLVTKEDEVDLIAGLFIIHS